jgi:hypothetical protein
MSKKVDLMQSEDSEKKRPKKSAVVINLFGQFVKFWASLSSFRRFCQFLGNVVHFLGEFSHFLAILSTFWANFPTFWRFCPLLGDLV